MAKIVAAEGPMERWVKATAVEWQAALPLLPEQDRTRVHRMLLSARYIVSTETFYVAISLDAADIMAALSLEGGGDSETQNGRDKGAMV